MPEYREEYLKNKKCYDAVKQITKNVCECGEDVFASFASYLFDKPYIECLDVDEVSHQKTSLDSVRRNLIAKNLLDSRFHIEEIADFFDYPELPDIILDKFPYTTTLEVVNISKHEQLRSAERFMWWILGYVIMSKRMYDDGILGGSLIEKK